MEDQRKTNSTQAYPRGRRPILAIFGLILTLLVFFFGASSGILSVSIEHSPTPDRDSISTLVYLMINGTQLARKVTEVARQPKPTSNLAIIQGKLCYPSQSVPAMRIYFNNTTTNEQYEFEIVENQTSYTVELPQGAYYAWAWATQYGLGGFYSQFVVCGMGNDCTDHRPLLFQVQAGTTQTGIDICDWGIPFPIDEIPAP